jgi:nitrite reductase/ring-hydroxylating ferredoxin subunit
VAGCNGCDTPKTGPAATTVAEAPAPAPEAPAGPVSVADAPPIKITRPAGMPPRQERPRPPQETRKPEAPRAAEPRVAPRPLVEPVPMWMHLGKKAEVEVGKALVVDLGGPKVAVFNVDGIFHVISNECGHQGGPLGEGKLEGFSVVCPWHQWKFDVTTGNCLSVGGSSVRRYEVGAVGDDLYVKV